MNWPWAYGFSFVMWVLFGFILSRPIGFLLPPMGIQIFFVLLAASVAAFFTAKCMDIEG